MVDYVSTVSIFVASSGVMLAAIYYVLQIRHQTRLRQTEFFMKLLSGTSTKEAAETALKYFSTEYRDYDDFVEKYGQPFAEGPVQTAFFVMRNLGIGIGVLLKNELIDLDLVAELYQFEPLWLHYKPLAEEIRKQTNNPKYCEWFEYLYNEVKRREQKLQASTA
jgi:hypothetical protein